MSRCENTKNVFEIARPWACGFGSGAVDILLTFPVNKLMFRQQLNNYTPSQAIHDLKNELKPLPFPRNVAHLYRGLIPPTFNRCLARMFTFGGYYHFKEIFSKADCLQNHVNIVNLCAALTSGTIESIFCCPFERLQTILQDDKSNRRYQNTWHLVKTLPMREYYRGIRPIILRNGISTFIYFQVYDKMSEITDNLFIRGAFGGIVATCYAYIFNVVRARQQSIVNSKESMLYRSTLFTLRAIYNERNNELHAMYRGFRFALLRTSMSWGITTWFYHKCYTYLKESDIS
jgi:hypothetical protein